MIPHINDFLEMHGRGELPIWVLVAYVVKNLSKSNTQEDFDNLPSWLRESVREQIASYQISGGWLMLQSNSEAEDYAPYAEEVIRKFDLTG